MPLFALSARETQRGTATSVLHLLRGTVLGALRLNAHRPPMEHGDPELHRRDRAADYEPLHGAFVVIKVLQASRRHKCTEVMPFTLRRRRRGRRVSLNLDLLSLLLHLVLHVPVEDNECVHECCADLHTETLYTDESDEQLDVSLHSNRRDVVIEGYNQIATSSLTCVIMWNCMANWPVCAMRLCTLCQNGMGRSLSSVHSKSITVKLLNQLRRNVMNHYNTPIARHELALDLAHKGCCPY